jgi:antitoxin component YwqK of YwqJK toxin-antitoxin module
MNKNIINENDKGQLHGLWKIHFSDNKLWFKCLYHNDKLVGYSEWYDWCPKTLGRKIYYI